MNPSPPPPPPLKAAAISSGLGILGTRDFDLEDLLDLVSSSPLWDLLSGELPDSDSLSELYAPRPVAFGTGDSAVKFRNMLLLHQCCLPMAYAQVARDVFGCIRGPVLCNTSTVCVCVCVRACACLEV